MSRFKAILISSFLAMQCAAISVQAEANIQEHVQVESRTTPYIERVALQEQMALEEQEATEAGCCKKKRKKCCDAQACIEDQDSEALVAADAAKTEAGYTSTHLGAYHHPTAITPMGEYIELEDGSRWSTDPKHRFRTLNWMTYDTIIVTTNKDFFSSYMFRLVNLTTGQSVACNLNLGPIVNGIYTHWIIAIDAENRELCLEDGSVWKMSRLDDKTFRKWIVNDTVIIGVNNRAFACMNPNILINVNVLNYSRCSCSN